MATTAQAIQAQAQFQNSLLQKANVVGVAVGHKDSKGGASGEVALVVLVEQKKPLAALAADDVVPPEIDGMRTDVYEVGHLRAQTLPNPRQRFRPEVPNGVSIGHYQVTAGTLSTIVRDRESGDLLLLSNNHVLANSNDAQIGDPVLQPAAMDGGKVDDDAVAHLERFVRLRYMEDPDEEPPAPEPGPDPSPEPRPPRPGRPPTGPIPAPQRGCDAAGIVAGVVNFFAGVFGSETRLRVEARGVSASSVRGPTPVTRGVALAVGQSVPENRVDAAVARPATPTMFNDDILGIGVVNGTTDAVLGMRVRKFGRTTMYTEGNVTLLNATVNVSYSTIRGPRTARFVGQVITQAMSQGGDSGSLIVDADANQAVGLLFAGSNLATIFTPIDVVLDALGVQLD